MGKYFPDIMLPLSAQHYYIQILSSPLYGIASLTGRYMYNRFFAQFNHSIASSFLPIMDPVYSVLGIP